MTGQPPAGGFPSLGIRTTPDAATSSPAAEREWYRMRTADTEKGSSYLVELFRANQFSWFAGGQWMRSVIELCDGQGAQDVRTSSLVPVFGLERTGFRHASSVAAVTPTAKVTRSSRSQSNGKAANDDFR